ncbi:MAG TPA: methyltransferase [Polyangiaceae bacterium]|nr:methyltransferase [Polyangiaceae bacterium]
MLAPRAILTRWETAARLVADSRDLLEARPGGSGGVPAALVSRGLDAFLLSLDDAELDAIETHGHGAPWPDRTPEGLRSLVRRAAEVCAVPVLSNPGLPGVSPDAPRKGETPRKRAQVDAFGGLIRSLSTRAHRVVDVGSGHGHLTREIAQHVALPVVGLERDPALAGRARVLSEGASPTFAVTDVLRDGLALSEGDCVVGLHACGELGDAMVTSVARSRGVSLALVGCCLQKRRQLSRRPLCVAPGVADLLDLPRGLLGLSNLAARDEGVEATRAQNLLARERRLALNRLLSEGGPALRLGAEIEGLNRRTAHHDLPVLVARAFAVRGRPAPTARAIDEAGGWARIEHARARRLSVPRALLARVLEVYVLHDRAAFLEAQGFAVEAGILFPPTVSPRNLALLAS